MEVRELGGDRLAEQDAARFAAQRDARRIGSRPMAGVDRRSVLGRHVGGVDDVLYRERHADERARTIRAVAGASFRDGLIGIDVLPGLDVLVPFSDAIQACTRDVLARCTACANRSDYFGGGELIQRAGRNHEGVSSNM
jgi:hypothetical protein